MVRMRHHAEVELGYPDEVPGVAGMERKLSADSCCCDQGVVGPGRWFAARTPYLGGNSTERACGGRIEWQRIEIGLGELEVRLPVGTFVGIIRDKWADRQFGKCDGADDRFVGKQCGISEATEQDDSRGIEQTAGCIAHSEESITESMSRRSRSGSTCAR
jgi:hypothetical protein